MSNREPITFNPLFIQKVVEDSFWYANKYNCTPIEALTDWEGDGPDGNYGLNLHERAEARIWIKREMKTRGE